MNLTKHAVGILLVASCAVGAQAASLWLDSYEEALKEASADGKFVLVDFSGSDWCSWCVRLDREVFSKSAFKKYAKQNLVCLLVDFPKRKRLPKDVAARNDELRKKFGVRGFPTVLLLSPDGEKLAKTGYKEGGAVAYVEHLEALLTPHRDKPPAPDVAVREAEPEDLPDDTGESRVWTDYKGRTLTGALVSRTATHVTIRKESGKEFTVTYDKFSEADREYLRSLAEV